MAAVVWEGGGVGGTVQYTVALAVYTLSWQYLRFCIYFS